MCLATFNLIQQRRQDINLKIDANTEVSQQNAVDTANNDGEIVTNVEKIATTANSIATIEGQIKAIDSNINALGHNKSGVENEIACLKQKLLNPDLDETERAPIESQISMKEMSISEFDKQQVEIERQKAELQRQKTEIQTTNAQLQQTESQLKQITTQLQQESSQIALVGNDLGLELRQLEEELLKAESQQETSNEALPNEETLKTKTLVQYGDTVNSLVQKQLDAMKASNPAATKEDALALLAQNNPDVIDPKNPDKLRLNSEIVFDGNVDVSGVNSVAENENLFMTNHVQIVEADEQQVEAKPKQKTENDVLTEAMNSQKADLESADELFKNRERKDGWAGDVANSVAGFFGSDNTFDEIKGDLAVARYKITGVLSELEGGSIPVVAGQTPENVTEAAIAKFEKTYNVAFNAENVQACMDKRVELSSAVSTIAMNDLVQDKLSPIMNAYNTHNGNFDEYAQLSLAGNKENIMPLTDIDRTIVMEDLESTMMNVVGDRVSLEKIAKGLGVDLSKVTNNQKFALYATLSKGLMRVTETQVNELVGDSLPNDYVKNLRQEYQKSHNLAYGENNDILMKVEDYVASQEIGTAVVKGVTKAATAVGTAAAIVGSGGTAIVALGVGTSLSSAAVDVSDLVTNDIDGDVKKNFGKISKNALIDGAMAMLGSSFGKSVKAFTSSLYAPSSTAGKIGVQMTNDLASTAFKDGTTSLLKNDFNMTSFSPDTGIKILVGSIIKSALKVSGVSSGSLPSDLISKSTEKSLTTVSTEYYKKLVIKELQKDKANADTVSWLQNNQDAFELYIKENL